MNNKSFDMLVTAARFLDEVREYNKKATSLSAEERIKQETELIALQKVADTAAAAWYASKD